jgi:hypothetical protein
MKLDPYLSTEMESNEMEGDSRKKGVGGKK